MSLMWDLEIERGINDNTQVVDFRGWSDFTAIDIQRWISSPVECSFVRCNRELCVIPVEFEEIKKRFCSANPDEWQNICSSSWWGTDWANLR